MEPSECADVRNVIRHHLGLGRYWGLGNSAHSWAEYKAARAGRGYDSECIEIGIGMGMGMGNYVYNGLEKSREPRRVG